MSVPIIGVRSSPPMTIPGTSFIGLFVLIFSCQNKNTPSTIGYADSIPIQLKADSIYLNEKEFFEMQFSKDHYAIQIPAGEFTMGSDQGEDKELPIHRVHLDEYWISKYPITVDQFARFVEATGYITDAEKGEGSWIEDGGGIRYDVSWRDPNFKQAGDHPVICVSWNDANAYCNWLSQKTGLSIQLPTEAQWEKAARGNDGRTWPWGNELPDGSQANFADANYILRFGEDGRNPSPHVDDGHGQTSPVDAYPKGQSPYGVYDMAGNVIDWLYDWYDASYYSEAPKRNPLGNFKTPIRWKREIPGGWADNLQRAIRGGAWTDASGELSLSEGGHSIRSDMRERTDQYSSDDHLGFRFVIDDGYRYTSYAKTKSHSAPARASVMESIGSAQVTIEYDRLAVNGREHKFFGQTVPYGEPWSPGDKTASIFTANRPVIILDDTLEAGSYNLYLLSEEISAERTAGAFKNWTIIFCQPASYKRKPFESDKEILRVKTRAQLEDNSKERMEFFFDVNDDGDRIVRFLFEFVEVHIPISVPAINTLEESRAIVMNAMGQTEIQVGYERSVVREKEVLGDRIQWGEQWSPGKNTIEFSKNVLINDQPIPKGIYTLILVPQKNSSWQVLLKNEDTENSDLHAFRQSLEVDLEESGPERLEFYFDYTSSDERTLVLAWDKVTFGMTIEPSDSKLSAQNI